MHVFCFYRIFYVRVPKNMTPLPHLYYNLAYSYNIIYEY